jgi:hypothetical protein
MKTHANQVAAFEKLLGFCNAQGATFNPSRESMKSTALTTLLTEAQKSIQAVHNAQNAVVDAINIRNRAFDQLPYLGTRIIGALEACDAPPDHLADVNRIRLRFRYQPPATNRSSALKSSSGEQTNGMEVPPANTPRGPVNFLGFSNKMETLAELIGLLSKEPFYTPNEADLSIEGLNAELANLREKHKAVGDASLALYNARQYCKKILFQPEGIHGTSVKVKKYVRSIFGFGSEQYRAVSKIKFKK